MKLSVCDYPAPTTDNPSRDYSRSDVVLPASRADAVAMDAADPLANVRDQFQLPDDTIYLCGNSLGPLAKRAATRLQDGVQRQWGQDLIRSWNANSWFTLPERLAPRIARLIGAEAREVTVADSTSVNLFKVVAAARSLRQGRTRVVTEAGNFPTDAYVLEGLAELMRDPQPPVLARREQLLESIDDDTAVVVLTHVHYKDSALFDMAELTQHAHRHGALIVWDLSHSVGALPVDLNACDADFALGCTYKYLNGGPGAPAFIYAATRHHAAMQPGLVGWWGHAQPFAFDDTYAAGAGMRRMLTGTGSILGMIALEAALEVFDELDMQVLRAKSLALCDLFSRLVEQKCAGHGLSQASALPLAQRGSHIALRHEAGYAIIQSLIRRNVVGDFRAPDVIRFGLAPLFVRFQDVWDAVDALADVLTSGAWRNSALTQRATVT